MPLLRLVLCAATLALAAVVALVGVGVSPIRTELALRSGCSGLTDEAAMQGEQTVMTVRAAGCMDPAGRARSAGESVDVAARAVWSSLRSPVHAVTVIVVQPADAPVSVTMSRNALEQRFGPGPAGVVLPVVERGPGDVIWILLPVAFLVAGVVMIWLAWRTRVAVVWFRR